LPMMVSDELVEKYKRNQAGTQCNGRWSWELKALLFSTIQQTKLDYDAKLFQNYHEYTTSTGNHVLKNAEDAIFSNFHEGFTFIMTIIRKFL
jgi:hypothetical protein